jgi:hypothetical protein
MRRRVLLVAVVAIAALAGCSALSPTDAPLLTVDNRDDVEYRLTVYVLSDHAGADDLAFRAIDDDGTNRSVGTSELRGNASFRDVTLEGDAVVSQVTVRAGATTTAAINAWSSGVTTVYVVETTDGTASFVGVEVITCESRGQEHELTVADGTISGRSLTCP